MEFGIQFFPALSPADKDPAEYFAESLDLVEQADALGYTHCRTVEHYFNRYGGYSPNPIVFLAAASQRTTTMRLITGAVLPVFNHPLKLAGEIGMLDALCRGRLDVGVARAFLPHEFRRFRISPDESIARYQEGVEQIDLLLREENVTHRGRFHVIENVTSLPRPTQKPRPKFYVAATQTRETFEHAGRNGYSLMTIPIGPIKGLIEIYRRAWRDAGHPGNGEVMIAFHMFCDADPQRARDLARQPFIDYFTAMAESTREWVEGPGSADYRDYDRAMAKLNASTLEGQIESGGAWVGSPSELRAQVRRIPHLFGDFDHASLQVNFGNISLADAQRSMRLFAAEVMPEFRSTPATHIPRVAQGSSR